MEPAAVTCTAFDGERRVATGTLAEVAAAVKARDKTGGILVFDDTTGRVIDLDLRGTLEEVRARHAAADAPRPPDASPHRRGPGRPRLGVVSREVTLLPRHWAWLGAQRGGASATLRRLVDQARKAHARSDAVRAAQDAAYRFMSAMAGDRPRFEEAIRALFAGDRGAFDEHVGAWPRDLREHARRLAADTFGHGEDGEGAAR